MRKRKLEHIIEHGDYMPHGMCLLWEPWLLFLWAGSDALIFLAYTAIPFALFTVLSKREDLPHSGLVALFGSFIMLCGLTHLFSIVTLWYPIYPIVGWLKLGTGLVSVATAAVLIKLAPALINFPSPASMEKVNSRLREEIFAHEETLASLERQIENRTAELKAANTTLAIQTREAVHRSGNLLSVVNSLATQTARGMDRLDDFLPIFLGRVRALANATKSIERENESSIDLGRVIDEGLKPLEEIYGDRFSYAGPELTVNPEAAQQISLALHELATNAQKYSLSASDQTFVEVNWTTNEGQFELIWREYGDDTVFPETEPPSEGFGTKLLTRVIPTMLRGQAVREFSERNMTYRLHAPLEAIVAGEQGGDSDRMAARILDQSFGLNPG